MMVRDHYRAHARRRVDLRATLQGRDGTFQEVSIRDLGLGGACVEVAEIAHSAVVLEREAQVTLEVTTPSLWDPLIVRGKIAWVRRGAPVRGPSPRASNEPPPARGDRGDGSNEVRSDGTLAHAIAPLRGEAPTRAGIRFEHRDGTSVFALFQLLGAQGYDAV